MQSSHLRQQSTFAPFSAHTTAASFPHSVSPRPEKKQRMGIASTYRLAHRARGKLSYEASRGDHDLRLLVGHANLLDSLMIELQQAEEAETSFFNAQHISPPVAAPTAAEPKRVQWSDKQHTLEVPDASDDEEEDSDSDYDEEEDFIVQAPRRQRAASPPPKIHVYDDQGDEDEDMESDDEYDLSLSLVRTRSHSANEQDLAVPELVSDTSDASDESDDESMPFALELDTQHIIVKDFAAVTVQQKELKQQREAVDAMHGDPFFLQVPAISGPLVAAY